MVELWVVTPEAWRTWRELRLAALAEAPYAFTSRLADWQGDGDLEDRWRARLEIPGSHNVVALDGGRPSGMASGIPEGDAVYLRSMWVSPAARGRGVADRLIREVERWARETRAGELRLCVIPGNHRAIACYRRNGFRPAGTEGRLLPDGTARELVMVKDLPRGDGGGPA